MYIPLHIHIYTSTHMHTCTHTVLGFSTRTDENRGFWAGGRWVAVKELELNHLVILVNCNFDKLW